MPRPIYPHDDDQPTSTDILWFVAFRVVLLGALLYVAGTWVRNHLFR